MLENKRKITINKNLLISLCFICLLFGVFYLNTDCAVASDTNRSLDEVSMDLDVEDKLENSQEDVQGSEYSLDGGTINDIKTIIDGASNGDTIKLEGKYVATSNNDMITINKKLNITSSSGATLDGMNMSSIFFFETKSAGSSLSNLKFINGYNANGGALNIRAEGVNVYNCDFENNYAESNGGAVYVHGTHATIDNCRFNNNRAENLGGGLATWVNALTADYLTVRNTNFTQNSARVSAGGLGAYANHSRVENCLFDSNYVCNYLETNEGNAYGGAIQIGLYFDISYGQVINCTFINNKAEVNGTGGISHGGAGCVRDGSSYWNCVFINNSADYGGAITYHASGKMENCTFYNNSATEYGGALAIRLLNEYMYLNISDCIFEGNDAPYGGAIKLSAMNIKIENTTFKNNHAFIDGGAVNIGATNVTIIDSKFLYNAADNDGGAIFSMSEKALVKDSLFISNWAMADENKLNDGLGGAIYINSTQAIVENNIFKLNVARNGSAIYYDEFGKNLILTNNTLFENQAWVYSLPIFLRDIYYGEKEEIKAIIIGGNNIADYDNLAVSNAIYNAAERQYLEMDDETPVSGATMSGELYQDNREYNIEVLLTVCHEDGTIVYNDSLNSNYLGEIFANLTNLKPGKYYVTAKHFEDNYYKPITNQSSFRVISKVDVSVKKTANSLTFNYDDVVEWTLNITNNGPNDASGVYLIDLVPEGLILLDSLDNYTPSTGKLDIGVLNAGENIIIKFRTVIDKTGVITNEVNVTSNELDVNSDNNYDNQTIFVNPAADLKIIKKVNMSVPIYGNLVEWEITVINNGPDIAHNVTIEDELPKGLKLINSTGSFDIGTLGINQEIKLYIFTLIDSTGLIENKAHVKGDEFDFDLYNNNDSEVITVDDAVDLAITISANATSVNYGDLIKWTLNITNNGPSNATDVVITELIPDAFISLNPVDLNIGNLACGEKQSVDIICKVNKTGNFTNIAKISSFEQDYNLENNEDNESIYVNPACNLGVIKLASDFEVNYGDVVVWIIHAYNNGPDVAHNVSVVDLFDCSLIWISDNSTGSYNHYSGIWDVGDLEVGEIKSLEIKSIINATGLIENMVSIEGGEFDYNLTNNQDVEVILVNESADLTILNLVNNSNPNYGDLIKWTLTASNNGPSNATSVYVEDFLPDGLILIDYNASKGFYDDSKWSICCLEIGEVENLEIICRVNKTGEIINMAKISGGQYDPNLTNNKDNDSISVAKSSDIGVIKSVNNTNPLFGEYIIWRISVFNNGPDNASGVEIIDDLPEGLILIGCSVSKGTYDGGIWSIDSLSSGEIQYLNITCMVVDLDSITNFVEANSKEYDWNNSNNFDNKSVNISPISDLSVINFVNISNPNFGDLVKLSIIVSNNGPNNASDVVVENMLPQGFDLIGSSEAYDGLNWDVGNLDIGESKILEIICQVETTGCCTNIVNVHGKEPDPDLSNNEDKQEILVNPASDLDITKKISKSKFLVGDEIEYVVEVINNGPDTATNVEIFEVFDDSLILKSFSANMGDFDKLTNTWKINSLKNGEKAILHIYFTAISDGIFNNEVLVSSDNYDHDLTNNNDSISVIVDKIDESYPKITKKAYSNNLDVKHLKDTKQEISKSLNLQKHITTNPFAILLVSILFSIIFSPCNILKK